MLVMEPLIVVGDNEFLIMTLIVFFIIIYNFKNISYKFPLIKSHLWLLNGEAAQKTLSKSFTFRLLDLFHSVQFSSVTQPCLTLCNPMNSSTPGLPVHHQLLELTKTHVHRVGDAIQPFHSLLSPFSPAPNPSQHQGLFK